MSDPDFPEELCSFITHSVPSVEAAEMLLLLWRHRERTWAPGEIAREMHPTLIAEPAARRLLDLFLARTLVAKVGDDCFRYQPESQELGGIVSALAKAYNERPVTLVRMIYALKDAKIQSFAEAFRIIKD